MLLFQRIMVRLERKRADKTLLIQQLHVKSAAYRKSAAFLMSVGQTITLALLVIYLIQQIDFPLKVAQRRRAVTVVSIVYKK